MMSRTYQDAVEHLNSLQSNAATLEAVRSSGGRLSEYAIPEMLEYLERIGYTDEQLNVLNVVHITGTKGKGSTSAFVNSILKSAKPDWNIGLYTSPHLVAVRERIRINNAPISEGEFAKYFFQVWDRLSTNQVKKVPTTPPMPGYFRFLTLMAFHVFIDRKVDATILEVGVGGTYDSTNVVPKPVVTGITSLGLDHVQILGRTIQEIAWQKGGIFKPNVAAFTVEQPVEAMSILESRSRELKTAGLVVSSPTPELLSLPLGLAGEHQIRNAALAVDLSEKFLELQNPETLGGPVGPIKKLPESFKHGLVTAQWPGRCQMVADPNRFNTNWYLDGAHTAESLVCCARWFVSPGVGLRIPSTPVKRILIFNCTSGRSGQSFLSILKEAISSQLKIYNQEDCKFFDRAIFCTNVTYSDGHFKGDLMTKAITVAEAAELPTQQALATAWRTLYPDFQTSEILVLPSIEHAITEVDHMTRGEGEAFQVLVTGSLHLVGGVIEVAGLSEAAL